MDSPRDTESWLWIRSEWNAWHRWRAGLWSGSGFVGVVVFSVALASGLPPVACLAAAVLVGGGAFVLAAGSLDARSEDELRVTRDGVTPSVNANVFIPREAVAGVELRRWLIPRGRHIDVELALGIRLTDGRLAHVPMVQRRSEATADRYGVRLATASDPVWRLLCDPAGRPIDWTETSDDVVVTSLESRIEAELGGFTAVGTPCPDVVLGDLIDAGCGGLSSEGPRLRAARWSEPV